MRFMCLMILFSVSGCVLTPQPTFKNVKQTEVKLTIVETDKFKTIPVPGEVIHAESDIGDGFCHIRLKKYPKCLLHEIRHCFEGDYHKGESSDEDC